MSDRGGGRPMIFLSCDGAAVGAALRSSERPRSQSAEQSHLAQMCITISTEGLRSPLMQLSRVFCGIPIYLANAATDMLPCRLFMREIVTLNFLHIPT